jgi:hypothetical protein
MCFDEPAQENYGIIPFLVNRTLLIRVHRDAYIVSPSWRIMHFDYLASFVKFIG